MRSLRTYIGRKQNDSRRVGEHSFISLTKSKCQALRKKMIVSYPPDGPAIREIYFNAENSALVYWYFKLQPCQAGNTKHGVQRIIFTDHTSEVIIKNFVFMDCGLHP
jgi:hypothetical protein